MYRQDTGIRIEKKSDILLKMIAISGELPSYLVEKIVGSPSYAASLITDLKKKGYIALRYKSGLRGYVLSKKGKAYVMEKYQKDVCSYLTGASETNHVKSEPEKRLRLYRMSRAWVYFKTSGNLIFSSSKPKIFTSGCYESREVGIYYGSQELKSTAEQIKGSRACGLFILDEEMFVVYHTMCSLIKWSKKMEYAMRCWVERNILQTGRTWEGNAIFLGNSMEFLNQILLSDGGKKNQLFQIDDIYENYYYVPDSVDSFLQIELIVDGKKEKRLLQFLHTMLDKIETYEFSIVAGFKNKLPVYFVYEMELRHLQMVKQDLDRRGKGVVVCLDYQVNAMKNYLGKEVQMMVLNCNKVEDYLHSE